MPAVRLHEGGRRASLQPMQQMRLQDGPSLSLDGQLCWTEELQVLLPVRSLVLHTGHLAVGATREPIYIYIYIYSMFVFWAGGAPQLLCFSTSKTRKQTRARLGGLKNMQTQLYLSTK